MKKRTCTKKVFTKRNIGLAFMLSAAFSLLLMPINAQALVRSAFNASLLADRNSLTLDDGEYWCEQTFEHQAIIPADSSRAIACNCLGTPYNFFRNHYGLYDLNECKERAQWHAWGFCLYYYSDKHAYAIKNEMPYAVTDPERICFEDCTVKWWNLSGKKTADGTRIQSWNNGKNKAENLFYVSYNPNTQLYRIWSAMAGKPVGYTTSDSKNLRVINPFDTDSTTHFTLREISPWTI